MSKYVIMPISDWREILYAVRCKTGHTGVEMVSGDVAREIALLNGGLATAISPVDWTTYATGGNLDSYNLYLQGQLVAIHPLSTTTSISMYPGYVCALYGWMAPSASLSDVGHYWDDYRAMPVWQGAMGVETEEAVSALGGVRFRINVSAVPSFGAHTLHYIGKLSTGEVISFADLAFNVIGQEEYSRVDAAENRLVYSVE